jgi:hypothetical protein
MQEIKGCVNKYPILFLKSVKNNCYLLLEDSIELMSRLSRLDDKEIIDVEIYKKYIDIEKKFKDILSLTITLPLFVVIAVAMTLIVFVLKNIEAFSFVANYFFGINAPERLITLGILGSLTYLFTSVINKQECGTLSGPSWAIFTFIVRLVISIVVPVVLVILFFAHDGSIKSLKITPELLSFGCGYSAKLVIDILNKIIQKCTSIINSL